LVVTGATVVVFGGAVVVVGAALVVASTVDVVAAAIRGWPLAAADEQAARQPDHDLLHTHVVPPCTPTVDDRRRCWSLGPIDAIPPARVACHTH
jgi:hypothetical protein